MNVISIIWLLLVAPFFRPPAAPQSPVQKNQLLALPLVYYTPETGLAYGAAASYVFYPRDAAPGSRPSSISPLATYTSERQFRFTLNGNLFLRREKDNLQWELKFEDFPDRFFGIGNRTMASDEELYTSRRSELTVDFYRRVWPRTYAGFRYHFSRWAISEMQQGHALAAGGIPGSRGGTLSGLSLELARDSRDSIYYPRRGDYIEMKVGAYHRLLDSDFDFSYLSLNLRKYLPLFSTHVLALQGVLTLQQGDVPFNALASLGGQNLLRGYFAGRYRDRTMAALQAEYRMPLFWRLNVAAFAGIGGVAKTLGELGWPEARLAAGMGLRYVVSSTEKITVRLDMAFGRESPAVYFSIFEAF